MKHDDNEEIQNLMMLLNLPANYKLITNRCVALKQFNNHYVSYLSFMANSIFSNMRAVRVSRGRRCEPWLV